MNDLNPFNDRLRWLALAHIVIGAAVLIMFGIPGVLSLPRLMVFLDSLRNSTGEPAFLPFRPFIKLAFAAIIIGYFVWGLTFLVQGILLKLRRGFGACRILAVLSLPAMPVGTTLGVLTLVMLSQKDARLAFESGKRAGIVS